MTPINVIKKLHYSRSKCCGHVFIKVLFSRSSVTCLAHYRHFSVKLHYQLCFMPRERESHSVYFRLKCDTHLASPLVERFIVSLMKLWESHMGHPAELSLSWEGATFSVWSKDQESMSDWGGKKVRLVFTCEWSRYKTDIDWCGKERAGTLLLGFLFLLHINDAGEQQETQQCR